MATVLFEDGIRVNTALTIDTNASVSGLSRSKLDQESLQPVGIPLTSLRVWDNLASLLPGTAATDDLEIEGNTFASGSPTVRTGDLKAAGATTRYARFQAILPKEYDTGADVVIRFRAGMVTTVADTSCTLDLEAYKSDGDGGIGSDLVTTSATTINSLTDSNVDFTITAGGLAPGDILDCRVAIACNDGASVTAVIGHFGSITLLCDTKG